MPVPEEANRKQQTTDLTDGVEGSEPISVLSLLRQRPAPSTAFERLKDALQCYSPVSILFQLTVRFLFVRTGRRAGFATGKMQRFSAIMGGGELGVSFIALDASKDSDNLARQLECYAVVQKYAERCPTWIGLAADVASSRIVDLCTFQSGPWQQDTELDRLADRFILTRAGKDA